MSNLPARRNDAIARPETFEDMMKMATAIFQSGFLPTGIKTPQQALAVMIAGREIGLTGMQAFRELYPAHQQIGMSTRLIVALYRQTGGRYTYPVKDAKTCTVRLTLADGQAFEHTLIRAEADTQALAQTWEMDKDPQGNPIKGTGKWKEKPMWKAAPVQMLANNCIKQAIRLYCPECLMDALGVASASELPADPEIAPLAEDAPKAAPANVVDAVVTEIPQDGPPIKLPPDVQMIVAGLRDMADSKGGQRCKAGTLWSATPATDGQRQMLARNMAEALGEMATDQLRHDICGIVFPGAANGMNMAQTGALIDWLVEKDADGKFNLKAKAVEQVILLAGVATAKEEMPF